MKLVSALAVGLLLTSTTAALAEPSMSVAAQQSTGPACEGAPAGRFTDTSGLHAAAVDCIGWWGIAKGVSLGTYDPAAHVQRGQMASFVAATLQASGHTMPGAPPSAFTDHAGSVHRTAIDQLAELGIVAGVGEGRYAPSELVTRAQMASYLAAAWAARTESALPDGPAAFGDVGGVHAANVDRLAAAGLTGGTSPDTYSPDEPVTRAQMATFLARLLSRLVVEGHADGAPADPVPLPQPERESTTDTPTPTGSVPLETWEALAECESDGDWSINTGNGYYGGLQFSLPSWEAAGGTGYPHEASKEEQIARAEIALGIGGWEGWPECARRLGLL